MHGGLWQLVLVVCWALAVIGLPVCLAALVRLVNDVARRVAYRVGSPGLLVAAANGSAHSAMVTRTVAVVGIAASVLLQVHYFTSMYQLRAQEALAIAGELNGAMLTTAYQDGRHDLSRVSQVLPEGSRWFSCDCPETTAAQR